MQFSFNSYFDILLSMCNSRGVAGGGGGGWGGSAVSLGFGLI